jgi:hypothetical protein
MIHRLVQRIRVSSHLVSTAWRSSLARAHEVALVWPFSGFVSGVAAILSGSLIMKSSLGFVSRRLFSSAILSNRLISLHIAFTSCCFIPSVRVRG